MSIKHYCESKKMQDLFGVRVVTYFKDDIDICKELIQRQFSVVDISEDHDTPTVFKPKRLNMVCELPLDIVSLIDDEVFVNNFIDTTFEIQLRTVFSEGWHEIEHDLRYKRKEEWDEDQVAARILNGIYATLETCDWTILQLFNQRALDKYMDTEIIPMIINKFRIKFASDELDDTVKRIVTSDAEILKEIYSYDRKQLIWDFYNYRCPINLNNLIYIINEKQIHNDQIHEIVPRPLIRAIYNNG